MEYDAIAIDGKTQAFIASTLLQDGIKVGELENIFPGTMLRSLTRSCGLSKISQMASMVYSRGSDSMTTTTTTTDNIAVFSKSDGKRYLLLCGLKSPAILIDRGCYFYDVSHLVGNIPPGYHLFDVENIVETNMETGEQRGILLCFDALILEWQNVTELTQYERLQKIYDLFSLEMYATSGSDRHGQTEKTFPISLCPKTYSLLFPRLGEAVPDRDSVLSAHVENLEMQSREYVRDRVWKHKCDGLVLTLLGASYYQGSPSPEHCCMWKWKPAHFQTIDLLVKYDKLQPAPDIISAWLCLQGDHCTTKPWKQINFTTKDIDGFMENGQVVECGYDADRGEWVPLHARPDKTHGNYYTSVLDVMEALVQNIQISDLVQVRTIPSYPLTFS